MSSGRVKVIIGTSSDEVLRSSSMTASLCLSVV